ncbi:MAG TPA: DUF1326 domain-containing protein [Nitrososphaerales archaeon]|nr:DUF1326 domain-containing protein [Nitrososphaerales archaeon]
MSQQQQIQKWHMKGDLFDSCSCEVTCPCNWLSPPTGNHCLGAVAIHIADGKYGDTKLDDLNIVLLADLGGGIVWNGGWKAGVIFDERANSSQREALETIMTGKAGGVPAALAALIKEMVGVEYAPISFYYDKKKGGWGASAGAGGAKVDVKTDASKDSSGNFTQIINAPFIESGTGPITTGKAATSKINAFGWTWDLSGKSSKHEPVDWKGP